MHIFKASTISEQAPRRRRKSLDDQNVLPSVAVAVGQDPHRSDNEFSDNDNIFENFKKSGKSISNLCKNEPNLSLLSSKISSILEQGIKQRKREKKTKKPLIDELQQQFQQQLAEPPETSRRNNLLIEPNVDMDNKNAEDL